MNEHAHGQRRWPETVNALGLLGLGILIVLLGLYLKHREDTSDARLEIRRAAICAILAEIPSRHDPAITEARARFARPGHPGDCQPRPAVTPSPQPQPRVTVTVVIPHEGAATETRESQASQAPVRRRVSSTPPSPHRSPSPRPAPPKHPSPAPSPSGSVCVLIVCLRR